MTDYYQIDAISASGLKAMKKSPAHYRAMVDEPYETTPGQILGSATHCAILEPELFDTRYTVMPDGLDLRSKAGKEAYALIQAAGKERLSQVQMDDIRAMQTSALAHPVTRDCWRLATWQNRNFIGIADHATPVYLAVCVIRQRRQK